MPERRLLGGRYRLGDELGRGGMGRVWEGLDERLHRPVAVKEVLAPTGLTDEQRSVLYRRTFREAHAAARISSSAAVTVFDVVEADGKPWIVMERLHPRTLADVLTERVSLPPAEAAHIGLRILDALEAAHEAGVLHRDVKPANVMVDPQGRAVLTDFGIAVLDGDSTLTTTGAVIGSAAYLAPERVRGETATAASDLWSLGATLYTAVEGTSPFEREGQLATLAAVMTDRPARPRYAGAMQPIVGQLLRKEPEERPTVPQVRAALQAVVQDDDREAAPPPPVAPRSVPAVRDGGQRTSALLVVDLPESPPDVREASTRAKRGPVLAALAVLAALVIGGWVLLDREVGGDQDAARPSPSASSTGDASAADPSDAAGEEEGGGSGESGAESSPSSPGTPAPAAPEGDGAAGGAAAAVPAGYQVYADQQGWSVAVPQGWEVVGQEGNRVDLGSGDGPFLRVDSTDTPAGDPVADWQRQEQSVSQRLPGYALVGIGENDFRGWQGADWEFTFQPNGGPLRVVNRNFVVSETEAHALYYSAPVDAFDPAVLDVATATFTPSG